MLVVLFIASVVVTFIGFVYLHALLADVQDDVRNLQVRLDRSEKVQVQRYNVQPMINYPNSEVNRYE